MNRTGYHHYKNQSLRPIVIYLKKDTHEKIKFLSRMANSMQFLVSHILEDYVTKNIASKKNIKNNESLKSSYEYCGEFKTANKESP